MMKRFPVLLRLSLAFLFATVSIYPAQAQVATAAQSSAQIKVPFEKYVLPNGLTVVLAPDHSTPTVAVNVLYHVGSKNEQVGRTGFAHLFEHVMFTGSGHVPYGLHDKYTEGVGGGNNGGTSNDFTIYYETVPSNYIEHALWLESDRMGFLLDALDTNKYNAQRDIVKNERRQRIDNQPYGRAGELISEAMYPSSNPYSWPVIGSMTDLSAASIEDVKAFFRLYYAPNNVTLSIAGDFQSAQVKSLIEKYFGGIPRGQPIVRPTVPATRLAAEKRLIHEDLVQVPRLYLAWPTVGENNDDRYALEVLADILTSSRISRLTKALVYDKQSAATISAFQSTNELAGSFQIMITPRPNHSLTELKGDVDALLAEFRNGGPTPAEVERSKASLQLSFLSGLESNLGKSQQLAISQAFHDDPDHAFSTDYANYQAVTAADVKRVAQTYLTGGRVVLSIVPKGKQELASQPRAVASAPVSAPAATQAAESFDRSKIPTAGKTPELSVPAWTKTTLANGAQLIVSERHGLPLVSLNLSFIGGAGQFDPANKPGVGSFVAANLLEGTTTRTGDQLSEAIQMLGSSLYANVGAETGSLSFTSIKDRFEPMVAILGDVLEHPTFPDSALERYRARTLVNLQQAKDRTSGIAATVFPKVLYTTAQPYGRTMTETSAKAITRADLVAFHQNYFKPGRAVITVVGDVNADSVKRVLDKAFADWTKGGSKPSFNYPAPPAAGKTTIYLVDKPGAAQSTFAIGGVGPARSTPDYYALSVMNEFLGGMFQSRLNANIREQKGYSYGVSSRFAFGRGPGAFRAGGEIVTEKSDSALIEFMKELKGIRGTRPITDEEMEAAKNSLIQSLPSRFESVGGVSGAIGEIYSQDLPENYFQTYGSKVNPVTKDDVLRVARKYLDPDHLAIIIVGDRSKIEGPLAATKIAPIVVLDVNGDPISRPVVP